MGHKRRVLAALSIIILLVLACSTASKLATTTDDDLAAGYDIDKENTLFLTGGQPRTLDPAITHSGAGGPVGSIFSGLVGLNTDLQVYPEIASGWEVSPDGTVYTFFLRPDAVFHDGRPVTADDVIFSWQRAANPETGSDTVVTYLGDIIGLEEVRAGQAERISGLRAIDDHTLEVRIDAPKPYFLAKLTYPVAYLVDRHNISQPDWEHAPNGTGPFKLQEWRDDEVLILARNENYYLPPAAVSHVVYYMGAGISMAMYEKGQIDLVGVGGSNLERAQDPNNPLSSELRMGTNMCISYVGFNNQLAPFDDPLVRQAFSYAVDRQKLIDGLYKGNVLPAVGPLPPGIPGYTGDIDGPRFNPEMARALLAQAGYADPSTFPTVTFTTSGYGNVGPLVTALITMWQDNLGVSVEPLLLDPFNYIDELYAGNVGNIFNSGWCADYPDPENFLDVLFHGGSEQNLTGYHDAKIDDLLEDARVEQDINRRLGQYQDIEGQIVADSPSIFLNHSLSAVLVKPYVQNYVATPMGVSQWHRIHLNR